MTKRGLNIGFLRARANPADPETGAGAGLLSRRQLFQLGGAAAVAARVLKPARAAALPGGVAFVHESGRAAFMLDGAERWVIDTRGFGGSPRLTVGQQDRAVRLTLSGALFPGTTLSADLVCEATLDGQVTFAFALGSIRAQAPLAGWLAGEAAATGKAGLAEGAMDLGDGAMLTLRGAAKAQFFPTWAFRLDGSGIAELAGVGRGSMVADSVSMAMPAGDQPSLLSSPASRRTLITLQRRTRVWDWDVGGLAPAGWQVTAKSDPFDLIHIESGLSRRGVVRHALAAEAGAEDTRLRIAPAEAADFTGTDGAPFALGLASARYARSFESGETALVARFGPTPAWAHAEGCSMLLGDAPESPGFEIVRRDGTLTRAVCAPALLGVTSPIKNAIVEPLVTGKKQLVALATGDEQVNRPPAETAPRERVRRAPALVAPLSIKLSVLRPEDLLVLHFEFVNLALSAGSGRAARLVRQAANRPAYLIVTFPPQAIAERAFYETETPGSPGDETPTMPPVPSRVAGPSRLVFRLPAGVDEIPYTMEALLSWTQYDAALVPAALPPSLLFPIRLMPNLRLPFLDVEEACDCEPLTPMEIDPPRIMAPEEYHTFIEAPYRVHLSPNKYGAWAHSLTPVTHNGRTELWHTRLGVKGRDGSVDELSAYLRTVRAIWSPDYSPSGTPNPPTDASPFRMSLTSAHRNQIVRLSSDFQIAGFTPRPIQADRLMLSALGAWLNVRGFWGRRPPGFTVEQWHHRAVMARDTYVRVVEPGYLFPYGHRAALITVTERKFQPTPSGDQAAYLRQRKFVVVRQPERTYPAPGQAHQGRQMPLKRVTLTTQVTPALDLPSPIVPGSGESSFWCRVAGQDFLFNAVTEDGEGQKQEFSTPLAFIKDDIAYDAAKMAIVAQNLAG
ncbi:MAG TPA: hypothetical protein VD902_18950, partial [Symbiobacteriaceae bacterium]|nr:hypothetical protein [Symbiobacteriaceae bacterium]